MKQTIILFIILNISNITYASNSFTPEQWAEILQLLERERKQIRAEILAELKGEEGMQEDEVLVTKEAISDEAISVISKIPQKHVVSKYIKPLKLQLEENRKDTFYGEIIAADAIDEKKSNVPEFKLTSNTDSSKAIIRVSRIVSDAFGKKSFYSKFDVVASAPIDKNNKEFTNIATLGGLVNAFDLTFRYSRYYVNGRRKPVDSSGNFLPRYVELCKEAEIDAMKEQCDAEKVRNAYEAKGKMALYPEYIAYLWKPNAWKWNYGFTAKIGHEEFNFIDTTTLSKQEQDETPWTLGVNAGFVSPGLNAMFRFGFEYQNAFKASKTGTVCPAPVGGLPSTCVTGNLGAPNENEKQLVYFEGLTESGFYGLGLRITHDFENDDTGVNLPLYLFRDEDQKLTGGIQLGWTNTDSITFGFFAGSEFKFLR